MALVQLVLMDFLHPKVAALVNKKFLLRITLPSKECPETCSTCSSASTCLTCETGYGLYDSKCIICASGMYLSSGVCNSKSRIIYEKISNKNISE